MKQQNNYKIFTKKKKGNCEHRVMDIKVIITKYEQRELKKLEFRIS